MKALLGSIGRWFIDRPTIIGKSIRRWFVHHPKIGRWLRVYFVLQNPEFWIRKRSEQHLSLVWDARRTAHQIRMEKVASAWHFILEIVAIFGSIFIIWRLISHLSNWNSEPSPGNELNSAFMAVVIVTCLNWLGFIAYQLKKDRPHAL